LIGAIELTPRDGAPGERGAAIAQHCYQNGLWSRAILDTIVLSPPLIISAEEITEIFSIIANAINEVG
jgi:beta-alanine--pyruvate transaminase